jgi:hypothetical protein
MSILNAEISAKSLKLLVLILLILVALAWCFLTFAQPYLQQAEQIELQTEQINLQTELLDHNIKEADNAREAQIQLQQQIITLQQNHFTKMTQEDVILLLDMLAKDTDVNLLNIGFSDPDESQGEDHAAISEEYRQYFPESGDPVYYRLKEDESDSESSDAPTSLPLDELIVSLSLDATYENSLNFIRTLENLPYDVAVTNFSMVPDYTEEENPLLRVNLNLWFYALPDTFDQDNRIVRVAPVSYDTRGNPFVVVSP